MQNKHVKKVSDYREYDFPNARVRVYRNRTCRHFPKWCVAISAERSRQWTAEALRELRAFKRSGQIPP